jgi:hypothetical protein
MRKRGDRRQSEDVREPLKPGKFIRTGFGLSFEKRREARKLGLLPYGKSFETERERLKPSERKERVFRG